MYDIFTSKDEDPETHKKKGQVCEINWKKQKSKSKKETDRLIVSANDRAKNLYSSQKFKKRKKKVFFQKFFCPSSP